MPERETGRARRPVAGTITRIAAQTKNPDRVSIYIDGAFAFGLPAIEVANRGLKAGDHLSEADAAALTEVDEESRATDAAVRFIAYRPRSEREVRDRLKKRGYSEDAVNAAVERVRQWGYLDDRSFAEFWVSNRVEHKPRGARLLAQELYSKGVDRQVVDEVLQETELNEERAALDLARQRAPALSGLDRPVQERRLAAYLGRRGFGWDVIRPVLRQVLDEDDPN